MYCLIEDQLVSVSLNQAYSIIYDYLMVNAQTKMNKANMRKLIMRKNAHHAGSANKCDCTGINSCYEESDANNECCGNLDCFTPEHAKARCRKS